VEDSISENFEAVTSNSNVDLMGVNGDKINVPTKTGELTSVILSARTLILTP